VESSIYITPNTLERSICNRERDRIAFVVKRDGISAALEWAQRVHDTYFRLLDVLEWRWNRIEFEGSCEVLKRFIDNKGILDKKETRK